MFKRKPSVQVSIKIEFDHGTLTTEKAKLEAEWDYGKTSTKKDIEIKAIFLCKISVELDASAHENAEIHLKIKAPDGGSVSEEYVAKKGSPIDGIEFEVESTIILKSNEGYEVTEWFNNGVMLLSPPFKSGSLVSSDVSVENARRNYKLKAKMGRRS
ncbi:MAG: hypothetical protein ACTTIZ_02875 [Treponema sp.]